MEDIWKWMSNRVGPQRFFILKLDGPTLLALCTNTIGSIGQHYRLCGPTLNSLWANTIGTIGMYLWRYIPGQSIQNVLSVFHSSRKRISNLVLICLKNYFLQLSWFFSIKVGQTIVRSSVTSKKSPNVYKSCPKIISLVILKILTPFQKLPKNVRDLGKLIVAKDFEKLPKVQ